MLTPSVSPVRIKKINDSNILYADDLLAAEEPLEIRLGFGPASEREQKNISVTMRTPGNDFELALGFLFTEGIINTYQDVKHIRYCTDGNRSLSPGEGRGEAENIVRAELNENIFPDLKKLERNFYTTSSCGVCGKASIDSIKTVCEKLISEDTLVLSSEILCRLPEELRKQQNIFEHTGGLHASALFDADGKLLFIREDIGRHNALDKLIGAALASGMIPLSHHILLLSGRASFELIQKAVMSGINIVAAVGAPSSLAVKLAKEFNITLIGFLRNERFNIYSGEHRIII
ncbi:MAG TPA: formate dehydrogenase accessory sulfurtransferase FdhD [Bacteroidia bacterium]|nr:formate dehydrogenase accessory sulfurtransferase FdhD [Bacteroidia bacterium]